MKRLINMVKEPKDVGFVTTGRQPSEEEFARISECIKQEKQRAKCRSVRPDTDSKAVTRQAG